MSLRIIFMGTPQYSVPSLDAIVKAGHNVVAVYSQPPRQAGRGMEEKKSPVHQRADALGIAVHTPASLKSDEALDEFLGHKADIAVVIAYGLLLPQKILDAPRLGCINAHASLLPRWRGAAPIQRAIEAGDTKTGVMIMSMEAGLDTGPVMLTKQLEITSRMNAGELHDLLADLSGFALVEALGMLENGPVDLVPQSEDGMIYASKLAKSESRIDWNKSARDVHNHIRAMCPFPGAWFEAKLGKNMIRIKVLASEVMPGSGEPGTLLNDKLLIACGEGAVQLITVQKAGKQVSGAQEFLRGNALAAGMVLS